VSARKAGSTDGHATRNPELSRKEILAAAMHEFASKGVGGARMNQIASRYGGSKNLIYHYYKSKDGLFTAVLETMYATIREHQRDFEIEHSDPATGIRHLVHFTMEVFDRNPEFVTLLHSENIAKARHVAGSKAIQSMYNRLLSTVDDLLSRGVSQGLFKLRISAIDLYVCICAVATFSISNRYTLSAIFGMDVNSTAKRKLRGQLVADMILAYLRDG
jgi:TetR/AcrR family transcriptional regulator